MKKKKKHIILQNETKNKNSLATSYDLARANDIANYSSFLFSSVPVSCSTLPSNVLVALRLHRYRRPHRIANEYLSHWLVTSFLIFFLLLFLFRAKRSVRRRCCRFLCSVRSDFFSLFIFRFFICFVALLCTLHAAAGCRCFIFACV